MHGAATSGRGRVRGLGGAPAPRDVSRAGRTLASLAALALGCVAAAHAPVGAPPVAPAQESDGQAIAIVNGRPIARQRVLDLLIESHGLAAVQQLVMLELAREEARSRGLTIGPADVQAEVDDALNKLASEAGADAAAADAEQKRRLLEAVLERRGLSMAEFMIGMERNACLRAIVRPQVSVDERLVREQFARLYGEKVEVRHIQLSDLREAEQARKLLADGVAFADVARRMSRNPQTAPTGGLLAAFAFNDETVPPALREAAFSLKPGEVSPPLRVDQAVHILMLERRIPPTDVRYESVRAQVERSLRDRMETAAMTQLATDLFKKARIRVLHPALQTEFERLLRQFESGQAALP